jgi:hypothetical protein
MEECWYILISIYPSQSAITELVIAMIDPAACIIALLYFYKPIDREHFNLNLRSLGSYRFVSSYGIYLPPSLTTLC